MTVRQWLAIFGLSLLGFTIFVDMTIVSNALPTMQKALHANHIQSQWILNALFLSLSCMMLVMGRLGDMYGSKMVLYISTVIFMLASLGAGLSHTINWLLFFRFLQGISSATVSVNVSLLTQTIPPKYHAKAMSIFSGTTGSGLALGPVLGGLIVQYINWSWIFFINVPILIVGLLLTVPNAIEKQKPNKNERFDITGTFLFIVGIASFVLGLTHIQTFGFDFITLIYFVITAIAFTLFVVVEKREKNALLHFSKLMNSSFLPATAACGACGVIIATYLYFDPLYLQTQLKFSPSVSGFYMLIVSLCVVLLAPLAGWITHKFNAKTGTVLVVLFAALATLAHAQLGAHYNAWILVPALLLFGIAWSNVNVGPVIAVTNSIGHEDSGMALGAIWTIFNIGCCAGLALTSTVFIHAQQHHADFVSSFRYVNWMMFAICLAALIYVVARMKLRTHPTKI